MPNQRKKGKTRIAVWLTQSQRDALSHMIETGVAKDMSDFVIKAIEAEYRKKGAIFAARDEEERLFSGK